MHIVPTLKNIATKYEFMSNLSGIIHLYHEINDHTIN